MNLKTLTNIINSIPDGSISKLKELVKTHSEIFLIGNGGSNAIASHMAVDYIKFFNKKCYVPNTSDLVTMMVNDYGVEKMYSKYVEYYHNTSNPLAILISSSGNSQNILEAVRKCHDLNIPMVLLTGFSELNPINSFDSNLVELKYWVDSNSYGIVEMAHHVFLHSIVEA